MAIVVGVLYFAIYLGTSLASSRAGAVRVRMRSLPRGINIAYLVGGGLLAVAGLFAWGRVQIGAIHAYLLLYAAQNLRRPMIVGYLSVRIDHRLMATGLSVETQLRSVLTAVGAVVVGLLADRRGVGAAILIMGGVALGVYPLMRLRESA